MLNHVAVVTGSSSGIGKAIAKQLATDGFDIVINYRNNKHGALALQTDLESQGTNVLVVQADISTEEGARLLIDKASSFGHLHVLINNAGVITPLGSILDTSLAQLNTVFSVNVFGAFLCSKEFVNVVSTNGKGQGGIIINISSIASRLGSPNEFIDYAATKGAVDTLTIGLAKEVAEQGIRVNAVSPGLIDTEMHAQCGDANRAFRLQENIPMKKVGKPEDVANTVSFLVSEQAAYITGAILDVSGGR